MTVAAQPVIMVCVFSCYGLYNEAVAVLGMYVIMSWLIQCREAGLVCVECV